MMMVTKRVSFFRNLAAKLIIGMELLENSIIVSDRLDGIFDAEMKNHFTHAYCTAINF